VDKGESAGSPYELNQLLSISLSQLRTERAGKGGAEREGSISLVQVEDGSGVEGRSRNGGRGEGTRRSQGRKGNVGKGETVGEPRDRRNWEGETENNLKLGLTCGMDQPERRGEAARERNDEAARKKSGSETARRGTVCEIGVGGSESGAQDIAARRELRRGVGTTGAAT
jgi:hypothetical protein